MLFSSVGTAQEAGAGGRSRAAGIPVRGSLMGRCSLCSCLHFYFDNAENTFQTLKLVPHHVTGLLVKKPKRRAPFQNTIQSESKFIHFNMNIGSSNTFSNCLLQFAYLACFSRLGQLSLMDNPCVHASPGTTYPLLPSLGCICQLSFTRAVLRLVWPFDGIVQKHIHKRLI